MVLGAEPHLSSSMLVTELRLLLTLFNSISNTLIAKLIPFLLQGVHRQILMTEYHSIFAHCKSTRFLF
jgi:hypothetical protein